MSINDHSLQVHLVRATIAIDVEVKRLQTRNSQKLIHSVSQHYICQMVYTAYLAII